MRATASERFWRKVARADDSECWEWQGSKGRGYGRFAIGDASVAAHRFAYEELVGPIPEGLQLDHLCLNRSCVNPAHLEPVTNQENNRRRTALLTRCVNGHSHSEENTYIRKNQKCGTKQCRVCGREQKIARTAAYRATFAEAWGNTPDVTPCADPRPTGRVVLCGLPALHEGHHLSIDDHNNCRSWRSA